MDGSEAPATSMPRFAAPRTLWLLGTVQLPLCKESLVYS